MTPVRLAYEFGHYIFFIGVKELTCQMALAFDHFGNFTKATDNPQHMLYLPHEEERRELLIQWDWSTDNG